MKLKQLFTKKPKRELFDTGEQVQFSQRRGRQIMKRIQKKGRA